QIGSLGQQVLETVRHGGKLVLPIRFRNRSLVCVERSEFHHLGRLSYRGLALTFAAMRCVIVGRVRLESNWAWRGSRCGRRRKMSGAAQWLVVTIMGAEDCGRVIHDL